MGRTQAGCVTQLRRALVVVCALLLVVLGFAGVHVEVVAIVVGLVLLGAVSVETFAPLLQNRAQRPPGSLRIDDHPDDAAQ